MYYIKKQIFISNAEEAAKCWNMRLDKAMKEKGYSQYQFVNKLNERYGTNFTQAMISDWLHVGETPKRSDGTERRIGFPVYTNMLIIADFLNVDVGYLTGETDAETFSLEKVCDFTKLTPQSICVISKITGTQLSHTNNGYFSQKRRQILNSLLISDRFSELIYALVDLDETYTQKDTEKILMQELENKLGKELFDTAVKNCDITEYDDEVVNLTDRECEAIKEFKTVQGECYAFSESFKHEMAYKRFAIQEIMTLLISELFPIDSNSNL